MSAEDRPAGEAGTSPGLASPADTHAAGLAVTFRGEGVPADAGSMGPSEGPRPAAFIDRDMRAAIVADVIAQAVHDKRLNSVDVVALTAAISLTIDSTARALTTLHAASP